MAATDQSLLQLSTRLSVLIRDPTNSTWSQIEVGEALAEAVDNDQWLLQKRRDTTLTSIAGQSIYPLPSGFVSVDEMAIDFYNDGFGLPIDRTSWDTDDDNIYFQRRVKNLPAGHTLIITGLYKLTSTDVIPPRYQNYVLHLAAISLLEMLTFSKTGKFLKNDTTMAEIMQAIGYHTARTQTLREQFSNRNITEL
jgi:hypothetical protein